MPFQKNNRLRAKFDESLDIKPLSIKLKQGLRDKVKAVDGWQDKLRVLIENWVNGETE